MTATVKKRSMRKAAEQATLSFDAPVRPAPVQSVRAILAEREFIPTQSGTTQLVPMTEAAALQLAPGDGVIYLRDGEACWWTLDRVENRSWGETSRTEIPCVVVYLREKKSLCGLGKGTSLCMVVEVAE